MTSASSPELLLPCSDSPEEEFQGPNGQWFSIFRAIVLDSWLTWQHALPGHRLYGPISDRVACRVTALAQRIHAAHMGFPEYRRLCDSPFRVGRWWDPAARDEWHTGSKVLLRIENYTAQRLFSKIPARLGLAVKPQSKHWVEISLPDETPCEYHSLDYSRIVTTEGQSAAS